MLSIIKKTSVYSLSLKLKKLNTLFFNFVFILTIILTPSIFLFNFNDVFEFPKIIFLSVCLSLLSFSVLFTTDYVYINKLDLALVVVVIVLLAGALFSIDFYSSLFGYFGNSSSSILFFLSIVIFLITTKNNLKNYSNDLLLDLLLISSIFPFFYGVLQILNLDLLSWKNPQYRIFSSFGQPNFFAIYLSILIFSCLVLYNKNRKVWYIIYFFALSVLLFYTYSLSSFISLCILLLIFFVLFFRHNKRVFTPIIIMLILFSVVVYIYTSFGVRIKEQVYGLLNLNERTYTNDTAKIRLILWAESFKQTVSSSKFFLGSGIANYAYSFNRPAILNNTSEWRLVFTRPHNYFVEVFFEGGILLLALYFYLLIKSFFHFKKNPNHFLPLLSLINAFFLWFPAYIFYIFYLFFYKNATYKILFKIPKYLFIIVVSLVFILSLVSGFANFNYSLNPCLSTKLLLNNYQPYHASCAIRNKNIEAVLRSYEKNIYNKTEIEKIGLYFLHTRTDLGIEIFKKANFLDKNNPVFLYYVGLGYELKGDLTEALKYYRIAQKYSHNFYENTEAIIRLTNK